MKTLKYDQAESFKIAEGVERRLAYTDKMMIVIVDFDGPTAQPDPPHSHPHDQVSYVAAGEIIAVVGDEQERLKEGDAFLVPSGVPHSVQRLTRHVRLVDCFTPPREDMIAQQ